MDGKSLHVEGRSMDFYVLNDPTDTGPVGFVAVTTIAEAPGWGIAMTFHHNATANTIDLVGVQMFDSTKPAPIGHPRQQGWGTTSAMNGRQASWGTWMTTEIFDDFPQPEPAARAVMTRTLLTKLPLAHYERYARQFASEAAAVRDMFTSTAAPPKITTRPGRHRIDDLYYAQLARDYLDLVKIGTRHPRNVLAERYGVSSITIRDHLYQARERGLLLGAGQGKVGGRLSEKARKLLANT